MNFANHWKCTPFTGICVCKFKSSIATLRQSIVGREVMSSSLSDLLTIGVRPSCPDIVDFRPFSFCGIDSTRNRFSTRSTKSVLHWTVVSACIRLIRNSDCPSAVPFDTYVPRRIRVHPINPQFGLPKRRTVWYLCAASYPRASD